MLSDRTTYAPAKHHAARDAADVAQSTSESTVSHVLRTAGGAPTQSLCTTPLYAPGAAHHVCLLRSARKQRCPTAAGLLHGTSPRSGPRARTVARSLAQVGIPISSLHATSVHKLLKLLLYVRGRLPHWAAVGGDDGAASCPAGGVLLLRQAAVARGCDALWLLDARSRSPSPPAPPPCRRARSAPRVAPCE